MTNTIKKSSILIFYDYFFPAYKAGGPIQSLTNLIVLLEDKFEIAVITGSFDMGCEKPLEKIKRKEWVSILLPGATKPIKVWYAGDGGLTKYDIKAAIEEIKPAVVYLNGIFSYKFVVKPLMAIKKIKIIICPRGMLQSGALSGKASKKKLFFIIMKLFQLMKNVVWHATNEEEENDIKKIFGINSKVIVAGNIPKKPLENIELNNKKVGEARLIYLSLITSKKNLLNTIENVISAKCNVKLDIYGPIKDVKYWEKCLQHINNYPEKIKYKGTIVPELTQSTFTNYDASIFLTKGENFGHALYESLSAGRPVITSYFTPWNNLQIKEAGWNVDINNNKTIQEALNTIVNMDSTSFNNYCRGSYNLAAEYYKGCTVDGYEKLFS